MVKGDWWENVLYCKENNVLKILMVLKIGFIFFIQNVFCSFTLAFGPECNLDMSLWNLPVHFLSLCVSTILTRLRFHLLFPFNLYYSSPPPSSSLILSSLPSLYFFHFITFFDYPLLSSPLNTFISWSSPLIFHPISPSFALVFLFSLF